MNLITKQKKSQQIAELSEKFSKSKAVILTEYKGLTVSELASLRNALREVGAEYKVVKNTLGSIAVKGTPVESAMDLFVGPTGIAFGFEDAIAVAKKVLGYAAQNEKLKVKSGIIEGRLCSIDEIKAMSKLPSRPVLLGMLAGAMQAPASKLACALNATLVQFAYALEALKNKRANG
ncbi:50S ribosomal protein L10 [Dissulfurispira thermophila]|uniref:Large ribosomal subunit protein uL10 n=2 Tax=root TaxID=1 RepID=A0A7G1H0U2_9BACT|nr:50S ribosomal protein L10 [Dissulfurispira thermophila]BCB95721.1 50S ribosomal protein L10 [Dissulfurispira thermophila]